MTYITQYQKDPSVNAFGNLRLYIQRHAYKNGASYAGAAPADYTRRGKSHFRVENHGYYIDVVFYSTSILRAFDDGRVVLQAGGYETSPTTRAALEHALWLCGYKGWFKSVTHNGYKNTILHMPPAKGGAWLEVGWEGGLTIAPDGTVTGYGPIKAYRADKQARKEWREKAAEFKAVLPVLLAGLESSGAPRYHPWGIGALSDAAIDRECWPDIARYLAYKTGYDAPTAWAYLDREVTQHMRVIEIVEPGWSASAV